MNGVGFLLALLLPLAAQTFTDIGAVLPTVEYGDVAWADYDNDGDLDFVLAGSGQARIYQYDHTDSTFSDISAGLTGVIYAAAAWGDYDNDGDLDILWTGYYSTAPATKIYRNNGNNTFTGITTFAQVEKSSQAWGDYDADGDLDLLLIGRDSGGTKHAHVYRNNSTKADTLPTAPGGLDASVSGADVDLSWNRSTDPETASPGLTYNLRMGTTSGDSEIMTSHADASSGLRRVPELGNTNHDTTWTLRNLPVGNYYWSVQAVDAAFAGSAFATEQSFVQPLSGTYVIDPGGTGDYTSFAAAVSDLSSWGVSGPVVFQVKENTYSEQITVPAISGASAANTITFKAAAGETPILQY